jgi:predicted dehydrogenase
MSDISIHPMYRREFLGRLSGISLGAAVGGLALQTGMAQQRRPQKTWEPVSDRKVRMGIVGYGVCQFGAAFGFQDHPNVEIVAVSDLIPQRCKGLMEACRCTKSYESLEELVKDPKIEAVFVATDAASHARHCIDVLNHGKHVMSAVPAVLGSIEDAEKLLEAVKKTGLKYQMAETSCYREDCCAMRQIYRAGGFGRLVYSEGEYYHFSLPPMWYPTHSTAYYVGVTGKRLTSVSALGFNAGYPECRPDANKYGNPFTDEVALFQTSEGGSSRMLMCKGVQGYIIETGRVFGEKGWMNEMNYQGVMKDLPDLSRPAIPPAVPAGGHGGSHGPLANEFITAILQDRQPLVNIYEALAMTVPGIVAHQSALKAGEHLKVPQFDPPKG